MTGQPLPLPGSEEFAKLFIHVNRVDPALARELHEYYRQVLNATPSQMPARERETTATAAKGEIKTSPPKAEEPSPASQSPRPAPQEPAPPQEKEVPKEQERDQAEKEAKKDSRKATKPSEQKPLGKEGSPDKYRRFVQQRKRAEALWRKLLETIDPNIKRWVPDIKKLRLVVFGVFVLFAFASVFWGDIKRALERRATPAQETVVPGAEQQAARAISPPEPPPPPNKEAEPPSQASAPESASPQEADPQQGPIGELPPPPNPLEGQRQATEELPPPPPATPSPPQLPQYGGELPPPPSGEGGAPAPTPAPPPPGGALITPTKTEGSGSGGATAISPSSGATGEGRSGSALFAPGGASGGNASGGGGQAANAGETAGPRLFGPSSGGGQAASAGETASSFGPRLFGEGTTPSGEKGSSLKEKGASQPALYRPGGEAGTGAPADAGTPSSQRPASPPATRGETATLSSPSSPSSPSPPTPPQGFSPPPPPPSLATGTPPASQGTPTTQAPSQPPPQTPQRPSGGARDQGGGVEAEGKLPIPFGAILKGKVLNGLVFSSDIGTLPILVKATYDGKDLIFFGGATLNPRTNRVTVRFDRAYVGNVAYVITGYLLDDKNNLGVEARGEEIAPNLALNLIRGALNGVRAYVDFFAKSTTTTIIPGTGVVSSSAPPPLGLTILSGLTEQLAAPPESTSIVRIWKLDPDTPVGVIVAPAGQ
jgi:hypothetical protein